MAAVETLQNDKSAAGAAAFCHGIRRPLIRAKRTADIQEKKKPRVIVCEKVPREGVSGN